MDWKTTRFTARIPGYKELADIRKEVLHVCDVLSKFHTQQHDAFYPVDIFVDERTGIVMHKNMCKAFGLSDNNQLINYAKQRTKLLIASYYDQYISRDKEELYPHLPDHEKIMVINSMEKLYKSLDELNPTIQLVDQSMMNIINHEIGDIWSNNVKVNLSVADMFVFDMGSIDALNNIHTELKNLWYVVARNSIDGIGRYTDDASYVLIYLALILADSNPGTFIDTGEGVIYEPFIF
jgi:hypothetical protein